MDVVKSDQRDVSPASFAEESARPPAAPPSIAPNSDDRGTILSIQILRFIAALSVVVFHAHNAITSRLTAHREDAIDHAFKVGASGVHVFFVISGFVMVYTTWRSRLNSGKFIYRRLIRIYPIYWVTAGIYVLAHLMLGTPYHISAFQILGAIFLFPNASSLIIGPGWTLSFEMYFYICFALTLFAGLKRSLMILSAFYLLSAIAGRLMVPHSSVGHLVTDSLLLEFIGGAYLGYAFARGFTVSPRVGLILVPIALVLFVSGFWLPYERLPSVVSWGIPSLLLVTGALAFEPWLCTAAGRLLARLGDSSYLLYLSHVLIIDLLIATPVGALSKSISAAVWISVPIALICTLVAAIGYDLIELPLLNLLKAWLLPRKRLRECAAASPRGSG